MKNTDYYKPKIHQIKVNEQPVSAVEYGLLYAKRKYYPRLKVTSSKHATDFINQLPGISESISTNEVFGILLLNRANYITGYKIISIGGTIGTVVDTKLVAKYALDTLSAAVILWHNHPSGNIKPSQSDISLTKRIKSALALLDVEVLDHLILSLEDLCFSFTDEGIMP